MTRTMGDATHDNVAALPQLAVIGGYVTGPPDVAWTSSDWARFPNSAHVTIDQGFTGSPVASATVRDVEAGAWTVGNAVSLQPWTAPRPTIYCSASVLPAMAVTGWQGDVWVADYINQPPTAPFPMPPGMRCVAWQWTSSVGTGGLYDLSVVFDATWPATAPNPPKPEDTMIIYGASGKAYLLSGGRLHWIQSDADLHVYLSAGVPAAPGFTKVTAAEEAALIADFPA